ncbi:MAG: hypothetical protein RI564_06215 [Gracilimonas sp.]|nr:hypothetical protein [Gracilimonas sp.]
MNIAIKNILFGVIVLLLTASTVFWLEAEKEIEILCTQFEKGDSLGDVTKTLDTGNLLSYYLEDEHILVKSFFTLFSNQCIIEISNIDKILEVTYSNYFDLSLIFAWTGILLSFFLMVFQLLLSLGYPLGQFAWGGSHKILPTKLRIGSFISTLFFAFSVFILWMNITENPIARVTYPVLGILFLLSSFANFNSESYWEKHIMTPTAVLLFLCYLGLSLQ